MLEMEAGGHVYVSSKLCRSCRHRFPAVEASVRRSVRHQRLQQAHQTGAKYERHYLREDRTSADADHRCGAYTMVCGCALSVRMSVRVIGTFLKI